MIFLSTLILSDRTASECSVLEEKIIKEMEIKYSNTPIKKMLQENKDFLEKLNTIDDDLLELESTILSDKQEIIELKIEQFKCIVGYEVSRVELRKEASFIRELLAL